MTILAPACSGVAQGSAEGRRMPIVENASGTVLMDDLAMSTLDWEVGTSESPWSATPVYQTLAPAMSNVEGRPQKTARFRFARSASALSRPKHVVQDSSSLHWFGGLPVEVVSEIVKYLPLDSLVAVAQLNKTAREFLKGKGLSKGGWAHARRNFKPPLTVAPTHILDQGRWGIAASELSWARWLLGDLAVTCVFCGQTIREPPVCISLNVYVCRAAECRLRWTSELRGTKALLNVSTTEEVQLAPTSASIQVLVPLPVAADRENGLIINQVLEGHEYDKLEQERFEDAKLPFYSLCEDLKETSQLYAFILRHSMHILLCRRPPDEQAIVLCHMLEETGVDEDEEIFRKAKHLRLLAVRQLRKAFGLKGTMTQRPFPPYLGDIDSIAWPDKEIRWLVENAMSFAETSPTNGFGFGSVPSYSKALYRLEDLRSAARAWLHASSRERERLRTSWREKAKTFNERMSVARSLRRWLIDRNIFCLRLVRQQNDTFLKARIQEMRLSWIDASNSPTLCEIRRLSESALQPVYRTRKLKLSALLGSIPTTVTEGKVSGPPASEQLGATATFLSRGWSTWQSWHLPGGAVGRFGSIELQEAAPVSNAAHAIPPSLAYLPVNRIAQVVPLVPGIPRVAVIGSRLGSTYHIDLQALPDIEMTAWEESMEAIKEETARLGMRRRDRQHEHALLALRDLRLTFYAFCQEKRIPHLPPFAVFCTLATPLGFSSLTSVKSPHRATENSLTTTHSHFNFERYLSKIVQEVNDWNDWLRPILTERVLQSHRCLHSGADVPVLDWACSLFRCVSCDKKSEAVAERQRIDALSSRAMAETAKSMNVYNPVYTAPMTYSQVLEHNCEDEWDLDAIELHRRAKEVVIAAGSMFGLAAEATRLCDLVQLGKAWICKVGHCKEPLGIEELVQHVECHSPEFHLSGPAAHTLFRRHTKTLSIFPRPRPMDPSNAPRDICASLIRATPEERYATRLQCARCMISSRGTSKLMTFDGLRAHLKKKHKIGTVGFKDISLITNGLASQHL